MYLKRGFHVVLLMCSRYRPALHLELNAGQQSVAGFAGTLGIFHGAALALRGRRVAVVERGKLQARSSIAHHSQCAGFHVERVWRQQQRTKGM